MFVTSLLKLDCGAGVEGDGRGEEWLRIPKQ